MRFITGLRVADRILKLPEAFRRVEVGAYLGEIFDDPGGRLKRRRPLFLVGFRQSSVESDPLLQSNELAVFLNLLLYFFFKIRIRVENFVKNFTCHCRPNRRY